MDGSYEALVRDAAEATFEGWDFGVFAGRFVGGEPSWSYSDLVKGRLAEVASLLDLGTGGGEFLSALGPLPARTAATESYPPNIPIARRQLEPLGVQVAATETDDLPFPDASFELITSRHESFDPGEVRRVLTPGGLFVTQQVGGRDLEELNAALGGAQHEYHVWNLAAAESGLLAAGLTIGERHEELIPVRFTDIGAVVLMLRITPWQFPGFDLERHDTPLRAMHAEMVAGRPFVAHAHRFLLTATS